MTVQLFTQNNEATSINLYNNLGQVCRNLYNGSIGAGNHIFELEGLTSGMYTLVVNQGDQTMTRKVVIR
jgi:hypothetical protein